MTRNIVNLRPKSCQQILNDKNLWALIDNELEQFKEYSDKCDEEYKNNYVYKVIELLTKIDVRHDSDSDDSTKLSDISEDSDRNA